MAQGTVLLLSGPSGCGKSTWLALVAVLVAPTGGTLSVTDQPLDALKNVAADAWWVRAIGFLPQKLHLSAALSVRPCCPRWVHTGGVCWNFCRRVRSNDHPYGELNEKMASGPHADCVNRYYLAGFVG